MDVCVFCKGQMQTLLEKKWVHVGIRLDSGGLQCSWIYCVWKSNLYTLNRTKQRMWCVGKVPR